MTGVLQQTADHVLSRMVSNSPRVPGVVAMVTDRSGNIYEGAAGKRMLGQDADMTTDCRIRHFFDDQSHHRHSRDAMCRGRQARPRCSGEELCARYRQASGARWI